MGVVHLHGASPHAAYSVPSGLLEACLKNCPVLKKPNLKNPYFHRMKKLILLASGHGLNDCIAGYLLASLFRFELSELDLGMSVLIYNLLAFGGQLPVAALIRQRYHPRQLLTAAYLLHIAALLTFALDYRLAILAIGIASAIIHVVGGNESQNGSEKARELGIFASPGILGLVLGGYFAVAEMPVGIYCGALALLLLLLSRSLSYSSGLPKMQASADSHQLENHDLLMILLLTVISFRSAVWNSFQYLHENQHEVLFMIGIAAMSGKLAGGFLADKIGLRRYTLWALMLSLPLLTIFKNSLWALLAGVFLLQSTLPPTARLLIRRFRLNPAMGVAWAFGLSIVLGGLFFMTPLRLIMDSNAIIAALILLSAIFVGIRKIQPSI